MVKLSKSDILPAFNDMIYFYYIFRYLSKMRHTRGKLSPNIKRVAKLVDGYLLLYKNMKYKLSVKILSFNIRNEEHIY
jgi:hypothetical protein